MEDKWLENRCEYNVDEQGRETKTKAVYDRLDLVKARRDRWEFKFKAFSALGIVVTLLGIFVNMAMQQSQMQVQADRHIAEFDNKVYRQSLRDLFIINRTDVEDSVKRRAMDHYLTEVIPDLYLVSNSSIRDSLQLLAKCVSHFKLYDNLTSGLKVTRKLLANTALVKRTELVSYRVDDRGRQMVAEVRELLRSDALTKKWAILPTSLLISQLDSLNEQSSKIEYLMVDNDSDRLSTEDVAEVTIFYGRIERALDAFNGLKEAYLKKMRFMQSGILEKISQLNYRP